MILGVLEIDWNFIDFLDHPNLRQHGQEGVKGSSPVAHSYQQQLLEAVKYDLHKMKAYKLQKNCKMTC